MLVIFVVAATTTTTGKMACLLLYAANNEKEVLNERQFRLRYSNFGVIQSVILANLVIHAQ